jgi:UDP-GlcNAc:undecaprenyl-phosphate GlcNAc-1-phosphate transferase
MDVVHDLRQVAATLGTATLAALLLTPLARRTARTFGIVDRPDGVRKLQQRPTALLGGVAVYLSMLLAMVACYSPTEASGHGSLAAVALGLGLLCGVGVCDDICNLRPGTKFLAQMLAMLPIVYSGYSIDRVGVFGAEIDLGSLGPVLSLVWLAACINAINLIDGVDGLASVAGCSIALCAGALATTGDTAAAVVGAAALGGSLLGFLVFNRPPASIYLGDAGSMLIGATLGLLSMRAAAGPTGCISLPLMLMLMAMPLGDTSLAIVRRWLSGRGIWCADRGHVHHRLLERGFRIWQLLAAVSAICLMTGGIALLTRWINLEGFGAIGLVALGTVLVNARLMGHHEWQLVHHYLTEGRHVRPLHLPTADQLPGMTFEAVWQALVKAAVQMHVARVELQIEAGGTPRTHQWLARAAPPPASKRATVVVELPCVERGACRLELDALSSHSSPRNWADLMGAAWLMAAHWAAHPSLVPGEGPRLFAEETMPAEQRRAA